MKAEAPPKPHCFGFHNMTKINKCMKNLPKVCKMATNTARARDSALINTSLYPDQLGQES